MNTKTKKFTWTSFAYALVLILLATTMVGIVAYAAGSKTHNIGGNVSFSADGIEATISSATWSGGSINTFASADDDTNSTVMQEIIFSTTQSKDTYNKNYLTWDKLSVVVDTPTDSSTTTTATISFTITNNSSSNKLDVAIAPTFENTDGNASMSVTIDGEEATSTTIDTSSFATINIIFTIKDTSYNAEITDFSIDITLSKGESLIKGDSENGYYIEMGYYPQTYAGLETELTELYDSGEDFTLADGTSCDIYTDGTDNYIQYTPNLYSTSYTYSDGVTTATSDLSYYKLEPIKWEVIGIYDTKDLDSDGETDDVVDYDTYKSRMTDESLAVISELGLEAMVWNTDYEDDSIDYVDSEIYSYLEKFYSNVLYSDYDSYIQGSTIGYDTSSRSPINQTNTYDLTTTEEKKIFLLSYYEANNWFLDTSDEYSDYASPSDFALATGAYMSTSTSYITTYRSSGGTCSWWLRSSCSYNFTRYIRVSAGYVSCDGIISDYYVTNAQTCVRPAMLVTL